MDDTLNQILLGLLTNALSAVFERRWDSSEDTDASLETAIASVIDDLADDPILEDVQHGPALRAFLLSPEINGLIRSLYVAEMHSDAGTTQDTRDAFSQAFAYQVPDVDVTYADRLFAILAAGTERVLSVAASSGSPWATQAVRNSTTRSIKEELGGIRAMLAELLSVDQPDVAAYERWEALYRHQVTVRHGSIMPPNTDGAKSVPIDDLYVNARFATKQNERWTPERKLAEEDIVQALDRMVILGDPGAGKSTFAEKLVYDLASGRPRVLDRALTPFLVTLKDYGAERKVSQISLVDWIERIANADYDAGAPPGAVRYLLNSGRAMVVFDGLDELLDTSYRLSVKKDVETFAARYFAAPILVTSRQVGYAQAPLDTRRFQRVHLAELDDAQVGQYVRNWFAQRDQISDAQRRDLAERFMEDSAGDAADLRTNTLMLGLLCNIFFHRDSIPPSRPAIYETCATMLFDQWDRRRRIGSAMTFERDLRPVIQHLAYWIYSEQPNAEVGETALLRRIEGFLLGRSSDDEDEARQRARQLLDVCRGRAWVFTDLGTDADGELQYQFTHRTFLEFFAAEYLVRTKAPPEELGAVLRPRIADGEWDVVAQLAFQLADRAQADSADKMLIDLLDDEHGSRELALSFAARSLGFLRPNRDTCAKIARAVTVRTCREEAFAREADMRFEDPDASEGYDKTHRHLVRASVDNITPVGRGLVEAALEFVDSNDRFDPADRLHVFLDVVAHCDLALTERHRAERLALWDKARLRGFERLWPQLRRYAADDEYVAHDAFLFGRYTVEDVLDTHGISSLFARRLMPLYGDGVRRGPIDLLLDGQFRLATRPGGDPLGREDELAIFGAVLRESLAPWDEGLSSFGASWALRSARQPPMPADEHLEGDALFGAFVAVAAMLEHAVEAGERRQALSDLGRWQGWMTTLRPWFWVRCGEAGGKVLNMGTLPVDGATRERMMAWAMGEWSVVGRPA